MKMGYIEGKEGVDVDITSPLHRLKSRQLHVTDFHSERRLTSVSCISSAQCVQLPR
jgi:hypothetical protein